MKMGASSVIPNRMGLLARPLNGRPAPDFYPLLLSRNAPKTTRIRVVDGGGGSPPPQVEITWQIAVGALVVAPLNCTEELLTGEVNFLYFSAGVTPFMVAGIEFGKRIMRQRKCATCGGSGLVHREGYYFRCPGCGGFLPWQSWKRFFTG